VAAKNGERRRRVVRLTSNIGGLPRNITGRSTVVECRNLSDCDIRSAVGRKAGMIR
jgi:hypothetical protein